MLELREVDGPTKDDAADGLATRLAELRLIDDYGDPSLARQEADKRVAQMLPESRLFDIVDGERTVGRLWFNHRNGQGGLLDVELDDPTRAEDLLAPVQELARAEGVGAVSISRVPRDPVRTAVSSLPGFRVVATNMALDLGAEVEEPTVALRDMTTSEYDALYAQMIDGFAAELQQSGLSEESAAADSRRQHAELIPEGRDTEGQHFFTAVADDEPVGILWLATTRPVAFVYDVEVSPDHRRRGYGAGIMNAGARWCQERDIPALGLNVFGHNPGARALYDKLGYRVTEDFCTLDLSGDA